MKIGTITCSYFMRVYGYKRPENFNWADMCEKYRKEFGQTDFIEMASEIRSIGYDNLEIWEPNFSYFVYAEEQAQAMAAVLKKMGFKNLAYCIGGWIDKDAPQVEKAYRIARALGAKTVTGALLLAGAEKILPEIERCGRMYGIHFGIENHPSPLAESPEEIRRLCENYSTIGANIDTSMYNSGYNLIAAANLLRDKLFHVHLKDIMKDGDDCFPLGEGDIPLSGFIKLLKQWHYDGLLSVEDECWGDPKAGLAKSLEYIKTTLQGRPEGAPGEHP
jgi:sugar phosphate isomerase/epimerase